MKPAEVNNPMRAAIFMLAAMVIIGVIDNFIVRLADQIGLWQFLVSRTVMALPLLLVVGAVLGARFRPIRLWAVALRSGLISMAMLFYFSALALMPIAQAMAGLFTSPIFVLLITALTGVARIGPWRILAVAIGFFGTVLVLQPDPAAFDATVLIPVAGGFFYALGAISTRALCALESPHSLLAGMFIMLGILGAVGLGALAFWPVETVAGPDGFVTRGWVWPMEQALPWVMLQAVGSMIGVFLIIRAYQLGEPSQVSVFEYSVMVFGPSFAWIAFGQGMNGLQVLGIVLIATAGAVIAIRSRRDTHG